jgi:hypothetical protein
MTTTITIEGADDHDKEDLPQGGKICKVDQGKEEGLVSANEIRPTAVQVDNSNKAFLLMVEATVVTATALSSTVMLRALSSLGAGKMTVIPGLLSPQRCPRQQQGQ